jgi:hypothetical protein
MHLVENILEEQHIYLRIVCINSCYGDTASAQVDPYVTGYPRMVVINPDRGEHQSIGIVRRVSQLVDASYKVRRTWQ